MFRGQLNFGTGGKSMDDETLADYTPDTQILLSEVVALRSREILHGKTFRRYQPTELAIQAYSTIECVGIAFN